MNLAVNFSTLFEEPGALKVHNVRDVGLLRSNNSNMIADSPGAMMGYPDGTEARVASLEIKKMTAQNAIGIAKSTRNRFGPFVILKVVERNASADIFFQDLVPTTGCRFQCLHDAAAVDLEHVLLIAANGSNCGMGDIIYAVMLPMSQHTRNIYLFLWMPSGFLHFTGSVRKPLAFRKDMENSSKVRIRMTFTRLHHFTT